MRNAISLHEDISMKNDFLYDVFLSFSSADRDYVRELWDELNSSGLKVFWSDVTLKENVGQSFLEIIQNSILQSRDLVIISSQKTWESIWVKEEYETFYNECFIKSQRKRRIIIYQESSSNVDNDKIPALLRKLQFSTSIKELIHTLGGTDIQELKRENATLRERVTYYSKIINDMKIQIEKKKEEFLNEDMLKLKQDIQKQKETLLAYEKQFEEKGLIPKRKRLPGKRTGYTQNVVINGQPLFLTTGQYHDGNLGEIFIDMPKEGAMVRSVLNCFATIFSIGLQYNVPLEEFVDALVFTRFEPSGVIQGHSRIKMSTSIIDFIIRDLAVNYLKRNDLSHVDEKDIKEED